MEYAPTPIKMRVLSVGCYDTDGVSANRVPLRLCAMHGFCDTHSGIPRKSEGLCPNRARLLGRSDDGLCTNRVRLRA